MGLNLLVTINELHESLTWNLFQERKCCTFMGFYFKDDARQSQTAKLTDKKAQMKQKYNKNLT